jgi:CheY-like chemotaxis protein
LNVPWRILIGIRRIGNCFVIILVDVVAPLKGQEFEMIRRRVLLVDDEPMLRLILTEYLSDAGIEVLEAEDGDHAVKLLDSDERLDLVVTDIQMPGTADGNAVGASAKQHYPGIPVIYTTGRPDSFKSKLADCDAFVCKPYGLAQLLSVIDRLTTMSGHCPANPDKSNPGITSEVRSSLVLEPLAR